VTENSMRGENYVKCDYSGEKWESGKITEPSEFSILSNNAIWS
jgi:hypothetical protein